MIDEKRLEKLLDLKNEQLEERVRSLSKAQADVQAAEQAVSQAAAALHAAAGAKLKLSQAGADWNTWVETQDWMAQQARRFSLCQAHKAQCDHKAARALAGVQEARLEVKRLDALKSRAVLEAKNGARRVERRQEDEHALRQHTTRQGRA